MRGGNKMGQEFDTYKRKHLIDILEVVKGGGKRIATYNCKTNKLVLYSATSNPLIFDQLFICSSLMQMKSEYEEE